MLLKRSKTKTFQNYWQFPEGKLEKKEKPITALKREIKEELGAEVKQLELAAVSQSEFGAKGIKYLSLRIIFLTKLKTNHITLSREHLDYQWVNPEKIKGLDFLPGTREVINSFLL